MATALPPAAASCPEHERHTAEAISLKDCAADPALEACCRRELEERAEVAQLKAKLSLVDRSTTRQQLQRQAIGPPPAGAAADAEGRAGLEDDIDSSDEEGRALGELSRMELVGLGVALLALLPRLGPASTLSPCCHAPHITALVPPPAARLRALRVAEMREAAARKAAAQARGLGAQLSVGEGALLGAARSSDQPLVAHLAHEGVEACEVLDEHLSALAHSHLGTRFLRVPVGRRSSLHLRLGAPPGPALVAFWEGSVLGAASLERFGAAEGVLLEEEVDRWLCALHVLHTPESLQAWAAEQRRRPGRRQGGEGGTSSGGESDEDGDGRGGDDWQQPCEVCGRAYPHEHIRSVYADRHSDSEDEDGR